MGKKSGPAPPDYTAAAEKTAQSNADSMTQQTWANRPTQTDPWGSVSWNATAGTDPATGKPITQWEQKTTLDPRLQGALDSQINVQAQRSQMAEGLLGRVQSEYGQPMDWGQLNNWGQSPSFAGGLQTTTNPYGFGGGGYRGDTRTFGAGQVPQGGLNMYQQNIQGPQQQNLDTSRQQTPGMETEFGQQQDVQRGLDFGGVQQAQGADVNRSKAENNMYASATSRLDPQWQQSETDMETKLANQGISRNSEAYSRAMDDFNRSKTDAYNQANFAAINQGGAEAQRNQGMDLALRGQQVGEIGQQGQFANAATGQAFGQDIQGAQARNAARSGDFSQNAQARQAQLAAQQQAFGQGLQGSQFDMSLQNQMFGQGQQAADYGLRQQQQGYSQGLQGAQFDQSRQAQNYSQQLGQQQQAFGQQQAAGAQNFNQQMAYSNYQNQLRQQQLQEEIAKRGFSLNEMQALLNGQQVNSPSFSNFNQAGNAGGVDYSGAASSQYNAGMQQQQMKNAATGDMLGGAASMAMMFSDAATKVLLKRLGTHARGFGIYLFRYWGETLPRIGVLAQEVARLAPELTTRHRSGLLMVDYSRI